jgi:hypothetical protein
VTSHRPVHAYRIISWQPQPAQTALPVNTIAMDVQMFHHSAQRVLV